MTNPIIIDDSDVSLLPTAKAYLTIDLAPLGHVTAVAEAPGNHARAIVRTLASIGSIILIGTAPALTIYASKHFLSAVQCLAIVGVQLAMTMLLATRPARRRTPLRRTGAR